MPSPSERAWRDHVASLPLRDTIAFADKGLVLGAGTVLLRLDADNSGTFTLRPDAAHDRMVALLAVAGRGRLAKAALAQIAAAVADWRRGDRGLAAIRLALAPLPRVRDHDDAYRLFLAETALDAGLSPNDLLAELGYAACTPLLKFDPNQPRVPAGSGAQSGQWTSGRTSTFTVEAAPVAASPNPTPASAASKPMPSHVQDVEATPVFFRPEDPETQVIEEKWRSFGSNETEEERIEEGRPLTLPVPGPIRPAGPGFGTVDEPKTPEPGVVPIPRLTPAPGGGAPPPSHNLPDNKGPACPAPQDDRPRGANANADAFEYLMSLIVNPLNPTPKQSPMTPNIVSQAYYLPTPTPDGKTSYDDCKKDAKPISIPGVRRGAMFEFKSANFGWQLYYTDSEAYREFHKQVENQNEGVIEEGLGRQIYYCLGSQAFADKAYDLLHNDFPNSHFLVCH